MVFDEVEKYLQDLAVTMEEGSRDDQQRALLCLAFAIRCLRERLQPQPASSDLL